MFKKGEAEAKAMNVKAEAYQEYNQAAVVDRLFTNMPEIVKAIAAPLQNIDKVTIVSTGNGDAAGAYKLTGDVTKIAAQMPALFEALSGMKMTELLSKVRNIGDEASKPVIEGVAGRSGEFDRTQVRWRSGKTGRRRFHFLWKLLQVREKKGARPWHYWNG